MNKYLILIFLGLFLLSCQTHKKSIHETTINELININFLRANMEFLSSDELEGREAGRRGEKILKFEQEKNFTGTARLAFVGYGITADEYNYDDYADINVEGKIKDRSFSLCNSLVYSKPGI
jgi:hypothetical protein